MTDLRIVYMGTPDFAVAPLKALLNNDYNVVAIVTAVDKPAGRGQKLHQSAVKQFALKHKIPVLQPKSLKSAAFLNELKNYSPSLQIVVAFRMLPKTVWQLPPLGTFNLHASLLPAYRGAAPINWAIINGETQTGVTTFFIDEKIDTGEIILQEKVNITKTDTAGSLHDKLMVLGSELVIKTVQQIKTSSVTTTKQSKKTTIKPANKLFKENTKINWNNHLETIYNTIRGLSPYPTAWCYLTNRNKTEAVKIYTSEIENTAHKLENGTVVVSNKILKVAAPNGFIVLTELQLPGKRKMENKTLLNGYSFDTSAKMH